MKTDIEIAQEAVMEPITKVAESIGIEADDLELYGKYKAKLSEEFLRKIQDRPNGKLILVTAINPTPAGEGKTTTTVGLGEAFGRMGKKAVIALREPSLGPCFGYQRWSCRRQAMHRVVPMDEHESAFYRVIFMPSPLPTTCWLRCWTIISSRAMIWASIPDRLCGSDVRT